MQRPPSLAIHSTNTLSGAYKKRFDKKQLVKFFLLLKSQTLHVAIPTTDAITVKLWVHKTRLIMYISTFPLVLWSKFTSMGLEYKTNSSYNQIVNLILKVFWYFCRFSLLKKSDFACCHSYDRGIYLWRNFLDKSQTLHVAISMSGVVIYDDLSYMKSDFACYHFYDRGICDDFS